MMSRIAGAAAGLGDRPRSYLACFFIDRPVFAVEPSLAITRIGAIAATRLPIGEFQEIAPPKVQVTALYPRGDPP